MFIVEKEKPRVPFSKDLTLIILLYLGTPFLGIHMGTPPAEKLWALFSASFCHDYRSHLINNLLMLWGIAPQLEDPLGSVNHFIAFLATGAGRGGRRLVAGRVASKHAR